MIPLTEQDAEHLGLLVLFHYLIGGIGLLFSLLPLAFVVVGTLALTGRTRFAGANGTPAPPAEIWLVMLMATVWIVVGLTLSTCILRAARFIRRCERYRFCLAVATAACVLVPAGTVLGVLTLLVLQRPTVKATFLDEALDVRAGGR